MLNFLLRMFKVYLMMKQSYYSICLTMTSTTSNLPTRNYSGVFLQQLERSGLIKKVVDNKSK